MGKFYSLLRKYNLKNNKASLPEWTSIYREEEPPVYWTVLKNILNRFPKNSTVFEIGSGAGDLVAMIHDFGFKKICGIELNKTLTKCANEKLEFLCGLKNAIQNNTYPVFIDQPDILIQVNCVYFENISTKKEYLKLIKSFYDNAVPKYFLLEVIDSKFKTHTNIFPKFVRLSKNDISKTFTNKTIESFPTYVYPKNTSSKTIYLIS